MTLDESIDFLITFYAVVILVILTMIVPKLLYVWGAMLAVFILSLAVADFFYKPDNKNFPTERYENYQDMVREKLAKENAKIDFKCHTCKIGLTRSQTMIVRATPYCLEHKPSRYRKT